ncbi:unnamed protein product [Protopolystoma xenopodis]|uniref:Uncharacterized protein n=1 Tax=Protopolystoma xenopodis TaxID=117903 RepID=A0A448WKM7_9PLAT|nr:unnamed protein product [Protopolystoma xenopodis]
MTYRHLIHFFQKLDQEDIVNPVSKVYEQSFSNAYGVRKNGFLSKAKRPSKEIVDFPEGLADFYAALGLTDVHVEMLHVSEELFDRYPLHSQLFTLTQSSSYSLPLPTHPLSASLLLPQPLPTSRPSIKPIDHLGSSLGRASPFLRTAHSFRYHVHLIDLVQVMLLFPDDDATSENYQASGACINQLLFSYAYLLESRSQTEMASCSSQESYSHPPSTVHIKDQLQPSVNSFICTLLVSFGLVSTSTSLAHESLLDNPYTGLYYIRF